MPYAGIPAPSCGTAGTAAAEKPAWNSAPKPKLASSPELASNPARGRPARAKKGARPGSVAAACASSSKEKEEDGWGTATGKLVGTSRRWVSGERDVELDVDADEDTDRSDELARV